MLQFSRGDFPQGSLCSNANGRGSRKYFVGVETITYATIIAFADRSRQNFHKLSRFGDRLIDPFNPRLHFHGVLLATARKTVIPDRGRNRADVIPSAIRYSTVAPACNEEFRENFVVTSLYFPGKSLSPCIRIALRGIFPFLPSARNESPIEARRAAALTPKVSSRRTRIHPFVRTGDLPPARHSGWKYSA